MGIYMRKKRKRKVGYLLILLGLISLGIYVLTPYLPTFQSIPIYKIIPDLEENKTGLVLQDQVISLENSPVIEEEILLPFSFIKEYIDPFIFWDPGVQKVTITTENKVIRMATEDLTYYVNQEPLLLEVPMKIIHDTPYLPISFLKQFFPIEAQYHEKTNIVTVDYTDQNKIIGTLRKDKGKLRAESTIKSPIIATLEQGVEVFVYDSIENWIRIRTQDGIVGYIQQKQMGSLKEVIPEPSTDSYVQPSKWTPKEGKINAVWHQLFPNSDSKVAKQGITGIEGLDVVSPTWFSIANEKGEVENIADSSYVRWAKTQGYQVWPLVDNKFDANLTHEVLSNTDRRENMIKQLLAFISLYELDGINIDFESVAKEDGIYFLQFIRELAPLMKEQGSILSVAMYVPSPWTQHYHRKEVGEVVDYIMIMAYDEHWGGSKESGSVASLGFVEKGIIDTLEQVPKEKILLGLPYYTRLWEEQEKDGVVQVKSKAYGMQKAYTLLVENQAEIIWDEEIGQYYGEYEKEGVRYRCWLEEERSIEQKINFVHKYDLAGVAGWKKGLEKPEIWPLLKKHLK